MTALRAKDIAPALRNIIRIRDARKGAQGAVYDRTDTVCRALDAMDAGASLRDALELAFNAGYVTGYLDGPDDMVASPKMLAAILEPHYDLDGGGR